MWLKHLLASEAVGSAHQEQFDEEMHSPHDFIDPHTSPMKNEKKNV